ncbi:PaaI family thioesterase [Pseudomonadales bacterium]|nr:PaaI family thioesterase [Pseudomonadales bacterium]MDB0050108.1 PaaI family thioesterase [Pseudomonadales bacterium]
MNKPNAFAQQLIQGDTTIRENFGIEVLSADAGNAELVLVVTDAWVNAAGFTHGSVAYAMMDSACAYACASLDVLGLTTSGNVTYVRGSQAGVRLRATAKVVSQSRRVMTFTTEVVDDQQRLLAHGSFVFQLVEKR